MLQSISNLDRVGEAFRYTGSLPHEQDFVDFVELHRTLSNAFQLVSVTEEVLSPVEEGLGYELELRREIEAELRAEYGDYEQYSQW